jgi:hypothetical protein
VFKGMFGGDVIEVFTAPPKERATAGGQNEPSYRGSFRSAQTLM